MYRTDLFPYFDLCAEQHDCSACELPVHAHYYEPYLDQPCPEGSGFEGHSGLYQQNTDRQKRKGTEKIIRTLKDQSDGSVWPYLLAYMVLDFLQRGGLNTFRDILWDPIKLYSSRELSRKGFEHIMNLSLSFHIRSETGEVLRTLELGEAVTQTFEFLFFRIVPAFVDVLITLAAFAVLFEWALTVTIVGVMFTHVVASIIIIQSRNKIRRQMNDSSSDTRAIRTDCLFNHETVKFFCGEQHEKERYGVAFKTFQSFEYKLSQSNHGPYIRHWRKVTGSALICSTTSLRTPSSNHHVPDKHILHLCQPHSRMFAAIQISIRAHNHMSRQTEPTTSHIQINQSQAHRLPLPSQPLQP